MISPCKKHLSIILTAFLLFFVISVPASQAALPLKQGYRGADVLTLQQQLQTLGYFQTNPTGYFGPITTNSILKLQADYQLGADGIVGTQTNQLINNLLGYTAPPSNNPPAKSEKEVLGFYVCNEYPIPSSYATLEKQEETITSISPFWYRLDRNNPGKLEQYGNDTPQEMNQVLKFTKANNIKNYALVHNLLYGNSSVGRDVLHAALVNPDTRWALVMNIYELLKSSGFNGVCIDIEDMHAWDRELYIQFLAELSAQLKPAGYEIIACVPSRTTDKVTGGWGDNFDFAKVGRYADMVAVMAYDEHTAGSKAGPIASSAYIERVIKYALSKLPPEKILLGVAGYGFDWNYGLGNSRYLSYQLAVETAKKYKVSVQWDNSSQAPYFNYTDQNGHWHSVYFENSSSLAFKLDAVNKYNLKGIALWRLGMEDPDSWRVIKDKLR
ncbi:glycosyl hydrolase family 18 protein [Desulfoscipio sp. XC116]|uniref:glycosyl hydrolase family 18 protein n=1 Tax=Desulfoscipio sp. XC116 TaxID=3144975 RepID=UPI00325B6469